MAVPVFDHTHLQDLFKTMELLHKSYAFYINMLGRGMGLLPPRHTPPPDLLVTEFI